MGVIKTPKFYKELTFDGQSSRDYGVFITGEAVFNAPERAVEMITIPGRNGSFALDQGRFENIEVEYPAGIFAENEEDFAEAISNFRNFLCSRSGYCRLEDEYNPDEYRLAIYKSGLEVDPAQLIAGEFKITFECKPQRWLTSGETAVTVADGGTIDNPTLFEASPLLEVEGYGNIGFNNHEIEIENAVLGDVIVADNDIQYATHVDYSIDGFAYNVGDDIYVTTTYKRTWQIKDKQNRALTISSQSQTDSGSSFHTQQTNFKNGTVTESLVEIRSDTIKLVSGTSSTNSSTSTITISGSGSGVGSFTATITISCYVMHTAADNEVNIAFSPSFACANTNIELVNGMGSGTTTTSTVKISSTIPALGNPTYIDCDIGECYMINNGNIAQLNSVIDLGSDLPTLASGTNTFNYDNTITDLKVVPRWWKV